MMSDPHYRFNAWHALFIATAVFYAVLFVIFLA